MPSSSKFGKLRRRRHEQAISFRSKDEAFARLDLPDLTEYLAPPDILRIKQEQFSQESFPRYDNTVNTADPSPPSISLLDTLPFFMSLSAAQNDMQETTITDVWMKLAAGYMAQAVAEQYLTYGSQRRELLQEAFAWGFDAECGAGEGSDGWRINAMFWGEDGAIEGWDAIRDEQLNAVRSQRTLV